MNIKYLEDEDFINYKKPSMFIGTSTCNFKCEKECGIKGLCQNNPLTNQPTLDIDDYKILDRYLDNDITKSIVVGGLEPFDQFDELYDLIRRFRTSTTDEFVIYTGYYKNEIEDKVEKLANDFPNIIIKFGRFIPNQKPHYDEVLGINLASDNQYAEVIS